MRYLLTGLLAGTALLLFYLIVMGLASGSWDYTVRQLVSLRYFVGALILGFSIQTGLFFYLKDCHRIGRVEKGSASASMASSSVAMLACCAHHLTDLLPFLGLSVLSLVLAKYQTWFLSLGIVSNAVGIYLMINSIRRTKI